ncbi:MAG: helix-turn-helix domain-containing protein [Deltaproteobacteria bacterium]|nr:helix-turn-helix domain-containing protein [Deltaproteobacteria bacterium]
MGTRTKPKLNKSKSEEKFLKQLGQCIVKEANTKEISIERLAFEADISKSYLYDLVKGQANPSVVILLRVADCLGIKLSKILPDK